MGSAGICEIWSALSTASSTVVMTKEAVPCPDCQHKHATVSRCVATANTDTPTLKRLTGLMGLVPVSIVAKKIRGLISEATKVECV